MGRSHPVQMRAPHISVGTLYATSSALAMPSILGFRGKVGRAAYSDLKGRKNT